jgi:hypothetical protein
MDGLTIATLCLVAATLALVGVTVWLVVEAKGSAKRQLGVQTWLEMAKRFDSWEMRQARKTLAKKIQNNTRHEEISETVIDFFEDVGTLLRYGYTDRKLVESTVAFYGTRWWEALQSYVYEERRKHGDDKTIFEDFEKFGREMRLPNEKIDSTELQQFLADEARLAVD